jgi:hypothetical protein
MLIRLATNVDRPLQEHLRKGSEQLAFLGTTALPDALEANALFPVGPDLLDQRDRWHLVMTDEGRNTVLRWAHAAGRGLIEVHTHAPSWKACFSLIDVRGLAEWAPQVLWRLPGRPYGAIVVAGESVDALVWLDAASGPDTPSAVDWDGRRTIPTGLSRRIFNQVANE